MKLASNHSKRHSSATNKKANRSLPLIEACESRQLLSGTPVEFAGEYAAFDNGQVLSINIRPSKAANSYTGDVDAAGVDRRFTAKENSSGVLSGILGGPGKRLSFDANLNGTTLTLSYAGGSTMAVAQQISTTPAPLPPTLVKRTHSEFKYSAPANWKVSQGSDGIVLSSPNGTEQVSLIATEANGVYTATQIADSEVAAGGTLLSSKLLADGLVSSTEYKQAGIGVLQFTQNGTPYVSGQIIETLNFAGNGGQTLTLIYQVTAPKAQFPAVCPTLIDILTSVQHNSTAKPAKTTVQPKAKVPGTRGNWSSNPAFAEEEDDYIATIEGETLENQDVINSSVNNFCNELLS